MTQSKIKYIHQIKEWKGEKWTVFYFSLEMENGDKWTIWKMKHDAFKVWDTLHYEIETKDGRNKFKEIKENKQKQGFWKRDYHKDAVWFAMSYAKDLVVAGKKEMNDLEHIADSIYARMIKKYNSTS